jgi:hypothetical protein
VSPTDLAARRRETTVDTVHPGRYAADLDADERVVFLIGTRINRVRAVRSWAPVVAAMPRMLRELAAEPELGLLGARTYVSGRVVLVVQYWASTDHLQRFATAADRSHLPAWKAYNQQVIHSRGAVGIFHETYRVTPGSYETVYGQMPVFGLAAATRHVPADRLGRSARRRLRRAGSDEPAVVAPASDAGSAPAG